jgi:hypothetical protein
MTWEKRFVFWLRCAAVASAVVFGVFAILAGEARCTGLESMHEPVKHYALSYFITNGKDLDCPEKDHLVDFSPGERWQQFYSWMSGLHGFMIIIAVYVLLYNRNTSVPNSVYSPRRIMPVILFCINAAFCCVVTLFLALLMSDMTSQATTYLGKYKGHGEWSEWPSTSLLNGANTTACSNGPMPVMRYIRQQHSALQDIGTVFMLLATMTSLRVVLLLGAPINALAGAVGESDLAADQSNVQLAGRGSHEGW